MLSAYQAWEDARSVDETAEMQFCESRQLNMSTLRMTSEAQVSMMSVFATKIIKHGPSMHMYTFNNFILLSLASIEEHSL